MIFENLCSAARSPEKLCSRSSSGFVEVLVYCELQRNLSHNITLELFVEQLDLYSLNFDNKISLTLAALTKTNNRTDKPPSTGVFLQTQIRI